MPKLQIHIGHHFFGSGNVGDDLMLAGFLEAARPAWLRDVKLTCCTPHDLQCQRLRFPEVEWLPYTRDLRAASIERSDAWLGLGDTPFQATGGHTWFLDHLIEEAAWCRRFDVPMFYLGVGVNERSVAEYPQMPVLVGQAARIWMRDDESVETLRDLATPGQTTAHADLAHLALAGMNFRPPEPGTLGLVLNFEDPGQFRLDWLADLVRRARPRPVRWLAQEVRSLPGSERFLHGQLPPDVRTSAPLWAPDYAGAAAARALLGDWENVEAFFVSRYHAAVIGAWMGRRVAVFARNDKVAGAARQLGLVTVSGLDDPEAILRAVREAFPTERRVLLALAERARAACEEFFALVRPRPPWSRASAVATVAFGAGDALPSIAPVPFAAMSVQLPRRLLFLRPDAYGDLVLFEPVPRIVRQAWPETEVAVLIREPYRDLVPLIASDGVRWLTTACNPYRQGPGDDPDALAALRDTVQAFAPDCVVAACSEQTWLESAVSAWLPEARQISLGNGLTDPLVRAALEAVVPVDWEAIYPEKISVEPAWPEWEKNLRLAGALIGAEAPRWWPVAHVPEEARARASQILADAGLRQGEFVVCAAAGTANVQIKSWPAEHYGATLAWLERERGVRALLVGHVSEREHLEAVRAAARRGGSEAALWTGQDGEMPVLAGLLDAGRFYFGNDTGALHLAAALGRPVVPIFGGGHWPRFQPVARRALTVVQPLPCFGCGWDCYFADAPCVRTILPESVRTALEQFLRDDTEGQVVFEARGLEAGASALIDTATPRLRFLVNDSVDRMRQVRRLTVQTEALSRQLQTDDADHVRQVGQLTTLLRTSEADRDARLRQVGELTVQAKALSDRLQTEDADHGRQIKELTALLQTSEADRDARLRQVEELTAQAEALSQQLQTNDADHGRQIKELTALLRTSEIDRDARLRQVEELTALLLESEADRGARGKLLGVLSEQIATLDKRVKEQAERLEKLTAELTRSPAAGTPLPDEAEGIEEAETPQFSALEEPGPSAIYGPPEPVPSQSNDNKNRRLRD